MITKEDNIFSVLTLNLRFGLADDGPNGWQYRQRGYPEFLDKYAADFMGFQEANDFQTDFLAGCLPEYNFIGKRLFSPSFWQNNIIFYKKTWKCIFSDYFFLSPTPEIPSRYQNSLWPRQCTMGMFKKNHRRIIIINTHFDFDKDVQVKSAKLIQNRLSVQSFQIPVVLLGDFNATPFAPCYQEFTREKESTHTQFQNTFHIPFPGTHHNFTGKTNDDHIDWILYRGNLIQNSSMVIRDKFADLYLSDHFPLYAEFL